jgi:hypothetical protein
MGKMFGRGELIALVHGAGVYEQDVARRTRELHYRNGEGVDLDGKSIETALTSKAALDFQARREKISRATLNAEYGLVRAQFGDNKTWQSALRANRLCSWTLRRQIAEDLRDRRWLDRQLADATVVSDEECRACFNANQAAFQQPVRFRASHLFLAAPPETPKERVEVKRQIVEELAKRLQRGERFIDLVAQFSEDEATRKRGGDLGYFSEFRIPPVFISAIRGMQVGQTSGVVQTALGFHLIQLTELKDARQMTFDEARPQILAWLANAKRRTAVGQMLADLAREAVFVR